MGQSFLKVLVVISLLALANAEPQFTVGIGGSQLLAEKSKFLGNTYSIGYTLNPFSRLQFGLRYEQTNIRLNKYENYEQHGLLGDIRFIFNTLTAKSPYLGYGFGWLNSTHSDTAVIYNARGSFSGEWLAGYTFRLSENTRLNLEYRNRIVELKYIEKPYQRSETILAGFSWIFIPEPPVQKSLTPAESITSKKDYLQKKITYNTAQISRIDTLIAKYDQRLLELGTEPIALQERTYLTTQKQSLEQQNQEMLKLLE